MVENNSDMLEFSTMDNPAAHIIKVMGVGGGGTNAVNHMFRQGITDVDFIVCNTDAKSLNSSPVSTKIQLGSGLGAGNNPEVAKRYAEESEEEITNLLSRDTKMLFITAGMGGGTGTGASPVIAEFAKKIEVDDEIKKILVIGIVTLPFSFEGNARRMQAEQGVRELRKHLDSILIINNDKLFSFGKMKMSKMFAEADNVLLGAAKSIADMITRSSYVNIDFRDVNTVMANSGTALMGSGEASGDNRAIEAIQRAVESPLLNDNNIRGAKNILLHFSSSEDYEIDGEEISEITDYIKNVAGDTPQVIWGSGFDESLGETLKVIFVATGFEQKTTEGAAGTEKGIRMITPPPVKKEEEVKQPQNVSVKEEPELDVISLDANGEVICETPESVNDTAEISDSGISVRPIEQDTTGEYAVQTPHVAVEPVVSVSRTVVPEPQSVCVAEQPVVAKTVEPEPVNEEFISATEPMPKSERESLLTSKTMERMREIMELKKKIATPGGIEEIERTPAYQKNNVILDFVPRSSESEVQRIVLNPDGTPRPNDFLNKAVD